MEPFRQERARHRGEIDDGGPFVDQRARKALIPGANHDAAVDVAVMDEWPERERLEPGCVHQAAPLAVFGDRCPALRPRATVRLLEQTRRTMPGQSVACSDRKSPAGAARD